MDVAPTLLYQWDVQSTYIHKPPYFDGITRHCPRLPQKVVAKCLLILGDNVMTDEICPSGSIDGYSPAAEYLWNLRVCQRDFDTYGNRRGNDEISVRGSFVNIGDIKKMIPIFYAACGYKSSGLKTVILAGELFGCGLSTDWAAKGLFLLGVRAVIAKSFDPIYRGNLVAMGIISLRFQDGKDAKVLGLTCRERLIIDLHPRKLNRPPYPRRHVVDCVINGDPANYFFCFVDLTELEWKYIKHGGLFAVCYQVTAFLHGDIHSIRSAPRVRRKWVKGTLPLIGR